MCCTSLFKLWRNGDLIAHGDGLLRCPDGIVRHESEILHSEQVRMQLEAEGIVPDAVVIDAEGKYRIARKDANGY